MKKIASQLALLAMAGTMLTASPTLAAWKSATNCQDPAQASSPACANTNKPPRGQAAPGGQQAPSGPPAGDNANRPGRHGPPGLDQSPGPNGPPPPGPNGPPPPHHPHGPPPGPGMGGPGMSGPGMSGPGPGMNGPGGMSPGRMGPGRNGPGGFDAFRHSFRFPHFASPRFDVRPGIIVPRDYGLRPLPPQIFAFYPMYRGYLFFVTPDGQIAVVSPRSLRIVAIL